MIAAVGTVSGPPQARLAARSSSKREAPGCRWMSRCRVLGESVDELIHGSRIMEDGQVAITFRGEKRWRGLTLRDDGEALPGTKSRTRKQLAQLEFLLPKLLQTLRRWVLIVSGRKMQADGDLLVSVSQAGEGGDILLAAKARASAAGRL
jgi:hypothetical protein